MTEESRNRVYQTSKCSMDCQCSEKGLAALRAPACIAPRAGRVASAEATWATGGDDDGRPKDDVEMEKVKIPD